MTRSKNDSDGPSEMQAQEWKARLAKLTREELESLVHQLEDQRIELKAENAKLRSKQQLLQESRDRYAHRYHFAPLGYVTFDGRGQIQEINQPAATMVESERASLLGRRLADLVEPDDRPIFSAHLARCCQRAEAVASELRLRGEKGRLTRAKLYSIPIDGPKGGPWYRTAVADVAAFDKTPPATDLGLLDTAASTTEVILVLLDSQFNYVWVNQGCAEMCGMRPEEMVGKNHFALYPQPEIEAIFRQVRDRGQAVCYKDQPCLIPQPPDETARYWDWSLTPVSDAGRAVTSLLLSLRETTRFKQAEEARRKSEERLQLASSAERERVEESLRRTHAVLDTLLAQAPVGFAYLDRELRYVLVNERLAKMNGLPVAEHLGKRIQDLLPELAPAACEAVNRVLATGQPVKNHEVSGETPRSPGVKRFWSQSWYPLQDDQGEIIGFGVVVEEITQRKRAEEHMARQHAVLSGIARIFHEALTCQTEADLGGVCLGVARQLTQSAFGFLGEINRQSGKLDEIAISLPGGETGGTPDQPGHPQTVPLDVTMQGICGRVLADRKGFFSNHPPGHPDRVTSGCPPLESFLGVPLIHADRTIGMIGLGNREGGYGPDELEAIEALAPAIVQAFVRKRAEAALGQSERSERERAEEFAALLDAVPTPVIIVHDPNGLHMTGNRATDELLRQPPGSEISLSATTETKPRHFKAFKDGRQLRLEELPAQRAARGTHVRDFEFDLVFDDGTVRHVLGYGTPLKDAHGRARGAVHVLVDITERKRAEESLAAAKAAADAANRSKSEFLANMSHEIRTPLTAVLGFTELLLRDDLSRQKQREYLAIVHQSGTNLLQLIDDILDLSKIEAGRLSIESLPCSPVQILDEVTELMAIRAKEKNLQLEVECHYPLPAAIHTDPVRLRQILVNLVGNAVKFTERGSVRVEIYLATDLAPPKISFVISDTGIGIPPEHLSQIFKPFSQADASMARRFGGTGLGLTISHRLAQMLGGDLTVTSQLGKGSTFVLTIDAGSLSDDMLVQAPPETQENVEDTHSVEAALDGRVLVVEDTADIRLLLTSALRACGTAVDGIDNGLGAIEAVLAAQKNGNPYHLILMDMQMPGIDGFETTRRLRAQGWRGPIIALTAHAMAGDRQRCLDAGCDDYLAKPINWEELFSKMEACLSPQQRSTPPEKPLPPAAAPQQPHSPPGPLGDSRVNPQELEGLLGVFRAELAQQVQRLQQALLTENREVLLQVAHRIAGSAGIFGFAELHLLGCVVEEQIRVGSPLATIRESANRLLQSAIRDSAGKDAPT